jgi:hypothetical protein
MLKDNTTFRQKAALRRKVLAEVKNPVVMETHGGYGELYKACYRSIERGVVFEKKPEAVAYLCRQRPTWAVYEADCVKALQHGAGNHLEITLLDLDPYGSPWDAIGAYFSSARPFAKQMHVVVQDGLRQHIRRAGAWHVGVLKDMVLRFGNDLQDQYLEVCRVMMAEKSASAGYTLAHFKGYYCGALQQMTHYWAVLQKSGS